MAPKLYRGGNEGVGGEDGSGLRKAGGKVSAGAAERLEAYDAAVPAEPVSNKRKTIPRVEERWRG